MKKVLLISSRFPYPPIGGDKLKNYNLIKILSKHYSIHFVSLIDRNINEQDIKFCEEFCYEYKIFKKSKYQSILNVLKSLFNNKPMQVNYYYFDDVQEYISHKVNEVDFIINTLIRTSEYVINIQSKPKFLDMVDSIALNYERSLNNVKSIFWRLIYSYEAKLLKRYEQNCIEKYSNTFFVNNKETDYWSKFGKTTWIPNGVNEILFYYSKKNEKYKNYIAFFGKMDYQPNIDAVVWFMKNVFNELNQDIKFVIVGINPTDKIKQYENDRVEITGYIDDPYEMLNSCFAIIAPMQTGGGIQNKILETMALGSLVVTNSLGADPIVGSENNEHLIVVNDSSGFVHVINEIYFGNVDYKTLRDNAKNLIRNHYTWDSYEKRLLEILAKEGVV